MNTGSFLLLPLLPPPPSYCTYTIVFPCCIPGQCLSCNELLDRTNKNCIKRYANPPQKLLKLENEFTDADAAFTALPNRKIEILIQFGKREIWEAHIGTCKHIRACSNVKNNRFGWGEKMKVCRQTVQ